MGLMVAMVLTRMYVDVGVVSWIDNAVILRSRIMRNVKRIILILLPVVSLRLCLIYLKIALLSELSLLIHVVLVGLPQVRTIFGAINLRSRLNFSRNNSFEFLFC
jgi:hypothetical protein